MKKILKFFKLRDITFFIIGAIIFGSVGITANYLLSASDVEYVDKDNKSTTVQSAITDLYSKAKKGSFETLPIGEITKTHNSITIPYTGSYNTIGCMYGTDSGYGSAGTIKNNACEIKRLSPNTPYNYKIIAIDNNGKIYETHDTIQTEGVPSVVYLDAPIEIYFNPVTNAKCSSSDYSEANSVTGNSEGCMKWYAYKREGSYYYLLLNHNVTSYSYYNYTNNNSEMGKRSKEKIKQDTGNDVNYNEIGYDLNQLTSRSENPWDDSLEPTLITLDDIVAITNHTTFDGMTYFYFDSKTTNIPATSTNKSAYAWLFNYIYNCEYYGCDIQDSSYLATGYWTSSALNYSNLVWYVVNDGRILYMDANQSGSGLRPVITVSNSILNLS